MRTEHKIIRMFNELPVDLQHEAHENYLNTPYPDMLWDGEYRDSLKGFERAFNVRVPTWQTEPEIFKLIINWDDDHIELTGLELKDYIEREYGHVLRQGKHYHTSEYNKGRVSRVLHEDTCCPFTGFCADEDLLDPIRKFMAEGWKASSDDARDILGDCIYSFLYALQKEVDFARSFEYYVDVAIANEWEYDEQGNMV